MTNFENARENESVELIRASAEDTQTLLDIEKTAIGPKTYSGYSEEVEVIDYIKSDVVYLIKQGGQVAGSISYEVRSDDHAHISGLVIKPEFQGQGVAKKALLKLLEELRSFRKLDLVVHPDNTKAVELYKSLGFQVGATKENFFGNGEPRLVMNKLQ